MRHGDRGEHREEARIRNSFRCANVKKKMERGMIVGYAQVSTDRFSEPARHALWNARGLGRSMILELVDRTAHSNSAD